MIRSLPLALGLLVAGGCQSRDDGTPTPGTNEGDAASSGGGGASVPPLAVDARAPGGGGSSGSGGSGGAGGSGAGGTAGSGGQGGGSLDAGKDRPAVDAGVDAPGAKGDGAAGKDGAPPPPPADALPPTDATGPAAILAGQRMELHCGMYYEANEVCRNYPEGKTGCPGGGNVMADRTLTFGGTPGTVYEVGLRFRGVLEPNNYVGGTSDGKHWYEGGKPAGGVYNIYRITISSPPQVYFLNYDEGKGEGHYVFTVDHQKTVKIEGGATVRLYAQDGNCSAIRNCMDVKAKTCVPYVIPDVPPAPMGFDGQFVQMDVTSVSPTK